MCLAMPVKVIKILANQRAMVDLGGIKKEISTALLENVAEGDYVILHVGYALTKLDEAEAKKTLVLFTSMMQGTSLTISKNFATPLLQKHWQALLPRKRTPNVITVSWNFVVDIPIPFIAMLFLAYYPTTWR